MNFQKETFQMKKIWIPVFLGLAVISGVLFWLLNSGMIATDKEPVADTTSNYQTSLVRKGDLTITATGTGTLVAGNSVDLSFSTEGIVQELNVKAGDKVTKGMELAKMNNAKSLEAQVIANELNLLEAKKSLRELQTAKNVNLVQAYQDMLTAQETYNTALRKVQRKDYARCSEEQNKQYYAALSRAEARLNEIGLRYHGSQDWIDAKGTYDTAKANYDYCIKFTEQEKIDFQASLDVADVSLKQAKTKYELLKKSAGIDPDELKLAEAKVEEAQIKLDQSKENLEGSTLKATIDGNVTYLKANVGAYVDTSTYLTISDLTTSDVSVTIDETDLEKLHIGAKANVVFDALPNEIYTGEVIQVNPELSTSGQYRVATAIVSLDDIAGSKLESMPLGVNASVTIISDEVTDALLIPANALRSIGNKEYGVFVVEKDGSLIFKTVQVGIKDNSTAQITSGLELNDVVSTGLASGSK